MIRFPLRFSISVTVLFLCFLWSQFLYPGEVIVPRTSFAGFPMRVGGWLGQGMELKPGIVRALEVDDYMMRRYSKKNEVYVSLYVGYYRSLRRAAYHSPKYCLPGNGWQIIEQRVVRIPIDPAGNLAIRANHAILQKGLNKVLILYWYQDRGRNIVSDYWGKWYVFWDSVTRNRTDGALVRISSVIMESEEKSFKNQVEFIRAAIPLLGEYVPD